MTARLRRSAARVLAALAAVLALSVGAAAPAAADVDDFTFDSFHADMRLDRAGDGHAELAVTETIVARFPDEDQNRGIVRAIPDDYDGVPLHTEVLSVTDASGADIPYEIERDGDFVEVATGDDTYVRGVQTYVIAYTQRDSIRSFADTDRDEFYRDVNGTGWAQPFAEVTATVTVDSGLAAALTGDDACYLGAEGSDARCDVAAQTDAAGAGFLVGAADLGAGENITLVIGFERGTFVPGEIVRTPAEQFALDASPALQAGSGAAGLAGIGALVAAIVARRRGRDATGRGIVVAQYDPPRGLSVLQAAHLVGRKGAGIAAAIVDLATSGHLRIVEVGDRYSLEFAAPSPEPARQEVLDTVFGAGAAPNTTVALSGDTTALARRLAALSTAEAQTLRAEGLTEPRRLGGWGVVFAVVLVAFLAALGLLLFTAINGALSWVAVAALVLTVLAGVAALLVWPYSDRVTDAGAEARDHLRGLREYLVLAEADRVRMLQSPVGAQRTGAAGGDDGVSGDGVVHLYERLLPYAIIWGVEKDWVRVLETRAAETGTALGWYRGGNGFRSTSLLAAIGATRTSAGSTAQWSSSGGGSFSGGSFGGGFSGGGAGGGGGGGR